MQTALSKLGSAFGHPRTKCFCCNRVVIPCVRCLCFITAQNYKRHLGVCLGSRYELNLSGVAGSCRRVRGKFSKQSKKRKRRPGRGRTRELFQEDKFLCVNHQIDKVSCFIGSLCGMYEYMLGLGG